MGFVCELLLGWIELPLGACKLLLNHVEFLLDCSQFPLGL